MDWMCTKVGEIMNAHRIMVGNLLEMSGWNREMRG
jgi:hypothetical protein